MKRSLWILSQPRVGSMLLCELLNRSGYFGEGAFQERFFHEPFFLNGFQFGENASSIRLDNNVLWLGDVAPLRARKFRRTMHTLLHGDEGEVEALRTTTLYADYRAALYASYRDKGLPEFLKIHRRHHFAFIGDEVLDEPTLRHHFENKDYLVLDRTDRIMQTVSLYIAFAKRQFIVTNENRADWVSGDIPYDEERLVMLHDMLELSVRRDWSSFLRRTTTDFGACVAYIDYAALRDDPAAVLEDSLCHRLGYVLDKAQLGSAISKSNLQGAARPESEVFADRLRDALKCRSEHW